MMAVALLADVNVDQLALVLAAVVVIAAAGEFDDARAAFAASGSARKSSGRCGHRQREGDACCADERCNQFFFHDLLHQRGRNLSPLAVPAPMPGAGYHAQDCKKFPTL